jgi:hypothetical protein
MAERIGSAYVRVFFRSSGQDLDDDIKNDKGFQKAGERAAKQAGEGFNSEWTDQLRERMRADEAFNKKSTANFKGRMTRLKNDLNKFWEEERRNIANNIQRPFDDIDRDLVAMGRRFGQIKANLPDFVELSGQSDDLNRRWGALEQTMQNVGGWAAGTGEAIKGATKSTEGFFARFKRGLLDLDDREGNVFTRLGGKITGIGGSIGRAFGKGSRNDLINFFGAFVGGLASLPGLAASGFGDMIESAKGLIKNFKGAGSAAEGLGATLAELGPAALAAIAGGLIALPLLLGIVSSAVMLLTGAVIALAGALTFALIGAVAGAAGALVPLVAGIGVALLAMTNMSKKSQHAFDGFKNALREALKPLAEAASQELFKNAAKDADLLSHGLKGLEPLVRAVAGAMRQVGEGFLKALNSPGAKKFVALIATILPGMIRTLGRIFGNLGVFMGEAFVAATPLVEDFLGWLEGLSQTLANLGKGGKKSKLGEFFADIKPTMHQVGHAIEQVIGLVFDLFNGPGQKQGGKMFQSLANNVKRFRNFLQDAKKDGSLHQFFLDARRLANKIGDAVVQIGKFIAALDTPANRTMLMFFVDQFTVSLKLLTAIVRVWAIQQQAIGKAAGFIKGKFADAIGWIRDRWNELVGKIKDPGAWAAAGAAIGGALARAFLGALTGLPQDIISLFQGLGSRIVSAIGNIIPHIDWPSPPGWFSKLHLASGGIVTGPTQALIGEAGPEAVVPLTGPMSQVDPAVRALAAFARGRMTGSPTTVTRGGRTVDVGGITIVAPNGDPQAIAQQVINRLAAASYV